MSKINISNEFKISYRSSAPSGAPVQRVIGVASVPYGELVKSLNAANVIVDEESVKAMIPGGTPVPAHILKAGVGVMGYCLTAGYGAARNLAIKLEDFFNTVSSPPTGIIGGEVTREQGIECIVSGEVTNFDDGITLLDRMQKIEEAVTGRYKSAADEAWKSQRPQLPDEEKTKFKVIARTASSGYK